jgi:hypothetical protein
MQMTFGTPHYDKAIKNIQSQPSREIVRHALFRNEAVN